MSFSATVKDELCRLELGKNCCMLSELAALYRTSGSLTFHGGGRVQVQYRVENTALARRIFRLLTARMAITPRLHYVQHARLGGRRTCVLTIGDEDSQRLMLALHLIDKDENGVVSYRRTIVRHHLTRQCCRRAYLRGAFIAAGSVSDPEKNYHLEFVLGDAAMAQQLRDLVNSFGLEAKVVERKEHFVIYLKEGEQIVDLLNVMGAPLALMDLENVRIVKEVRNDVNRRVNCETANLSKVVGAAVKQLEDIAYIEKTIGLSNLPEQLEEMARVRLEYPDTSLKELGSYLATPVGKSGVNHRLRKISSIAETLREGKGEAK